jgi:hypothetical protein
VALILIVANITMQLPLFNVAVFFGILPIMLYCFFFSGWLTAKPERLTPVARCQ